MTTSTNSLSLPMAAFVADRKRIFESQIPAWEGVKIFLEQVRRRAQAEMSDRAGEILPVIQRWENMGNSARELRSGADINWGSHLLGEMFSEIEAVLAS